VDGVMLPVEEIAVAAETFGVSAAQVRRDHLISLLLGLLSRDVADEVLFFGGTALARTHLVEGRLSEDIDLIVRSGRTRTAVAATIDALFATGLRRVLGRLEWRPALSAVRTAQAATLYGPDGVSVRIQLLDGLGYPQWPTELRDLHQRYSDAPSAKLWVPVRAAFAAWKLAAWFDRKAPRDLWDLWALASIGAIDDAALDLYVRLGPTGSPPAPWLFTQLPSEERWYEALAAQTRLTVSAAEAARVVAAAWRCA
jgi:hypothetical protein